MFYSCGTKHFIEVEKCDQEFVICTMEYLGQAIFYEQRSIWEGHSVREKNIRRTELIFMVTLKYLRTGYFTCCEMSSCESEVLFEACITDYPTLCEWEDEVRKVTAHYDVIDSSSFKTLKHDLLKLINTSKVDIRKIYWLPVSHYCLVHQCGTVQLYRQVDGASSGQPIDFECVSKKIDEEEDPFLEYESQQCTKKQKKEF